MGDWGAGSTRANSGLYHRICVSFGPEGEPQCKLRGGQPQHELRLGALRPKGAESSREMAQQALIPTVGFFRWTSLDACSVSLLFFLLPS